MPDAPPPDAPVPPQRISPITFPADDPVLPRPGEDSPAAVRDAFRETTFALAPDLAWLRDALRLQRAIVEASYPSKYRNRRYASALLGWSRVYSAGLVLWRATAWAEYAAVPPLVRHALEWLAAEQAVVGGERAEFDAWLAPAFQPRTQPSAVEVGMGQYMAGQQLARDADLGAVYRTAAELARPHFGAAALLHAPESNRQRLQLHWGDQAFHLGWAQLLFGWQIVLHRRQIGFAVECDLFAVDAAARERAQALSRQAESLLGGASRCRAEWLAIDGRQRLLVRNFRRQPSGAPKDLLL